MPRMGSQNQKDVQCLYPSQVRSKSHQPYRLSHHHPIRWRRHRTATKDSWLHQHQSSSLAENVGDAAAYYVIEYNDKRIEDLAKEGNLSYKDYVAKISGEYKPSYSVISFVGNFDPAKSSAKYADAIYVIYKDKDIKSTWSWWTNTSSWWVRTPHRPTMVRQHRIFITQLARNSLLPTTRLPSIGWKSIDRWNIRRWPHQLPRHDWR